MNFAAHINTSTGLVEFISMSNSHHPYADGSTHEGRLVKLVLETADAENKYWDGTQLVELPPIPGQFFEWTAYEWVLNTVAAEEWMRQERNHRLGRSDWTQFNDSPLTAEQQAAWATYRQQLRDFPNGLVITRIEDLSWPVEP